MSRGEYRKNDYKEKTLTAWNMGCFTGGFTRA